MQWFNQFFHRLFSWVPGFRNGSGWRGFKAINTARVDSPEEFRRQNDV